MRARLLLLVWLAAASAACGTGDHELEGADAAPDDATANGHHRTDSGPGRQDATADHEDGGKTDSGPDKPDAAADRDGSGKVDSGPDARNDATDLDASVDATDAAQEGRCEAGSCPNGFACNGNSCYTTCSADVQCASATPYCVAAMCQATAPLGHACTSQTACANCVNGVCCSTSSCPATDQCHVAGTCSSATGQCAASPPAPNTTPCTASHAASALCDGAGNCLAVSCNNGYENDQGACKAPGCTGVVCGGSDGAGGLCTGSSGACGTGQICSNAGQCVCNSTSCSGCCDATAHCQTSSAATCGIGGASCQTCPGCCSVSGTCAQNLYPDMDHDGFGDKTATPVCGQASTSLVADNSDCCDTDSRAHPQALPAAPSLYPGLTDAGIGPQTPDNCGSYDYNCSGAVEARYTNLCTSANYGCAADCSTFMTGTCATCSTGAPLPVSCPVAPATDGTVYGSSQPACGGTFQEGGEFCETQSTSPLMCFVDPYGKDPLTYYQLCF